MSIFQWKILHSKIVWLQCDTPVASAGDKNMHSCSSILLGT